MRIKEIVSHVVKPNFQDWVFRVAQCLARWTPHRAVWVQALGHCVLFLGKTLYSHGASLHPGVLMNASEFNAGGDPAMD